MAELAGSATLLDAYFDIRFSPKLRLRSGKDKTPVGYELLISDACAGLPRTLARLAARAEPRRRLSGAGRPRRRQAALRGRRLQRQSGRRHQLHDRRRHEQRQGSRRTRRRPIRSGSATEPPHRAGELRRFISAASTGTETGRAPDRSGRRPDRPTSRFRPRVTADGTRNRVTPAVFLYAKALRRLRGVRAHDAGHPSSGDAVSTVTNQAWSVTATYVLTGESTSERGVKPQAAVRSRGRTVGRRAARGAGTPELPLDGAALRRRHRRRHVPAARRSR